MAASPTVAAITSAIVTAVKSALNPGDPTKVKTVHDYRRWWFEEDLFRKFFVRPSDDLLPGKINGWMVFRKSTREVETEERWRFYQIHRFELHGLMGVKDADATANEKAFQAQVEAVRDNIRLNTSIFGNMERTAPVCQVEVMDVQREIEPTCWWAVLSLEAEGIETKTL